MRKHDSFIKGCLVALVILLQTCVMAQTITLRQIPQQDELPVKAIHRIFQDSEGYMWFGTFNGLCRYDGYHIKVFRSDFRHPGLLKSNYITYIAEDHAHNLWFGTLKGAYILDKKTYAIFPVRLPTGTDPSVFTLNVTNDGSVWVSTSGKLLKYRADGTLLKVYPTTAGGKPQSVYFVYEDQKGQLLISMTRGGMYRLDPGSDSFQPYHRDARFMDVERILWDSRNRCYWLGTWGQGVVRFEPDAPGGNTYVPQPLPADVTGKPSGRLFHMVQDNVLHYLWVTTDKDLFAFRVGPDKMLRRVDTSPFLPRQNKMLYEIYKDNESALWVSAFDGESFILTIQEQTLQYFDFPLLKESVKANPSIIALCIDSRGLYWIVQERAGLFLYDRKGSRLIPCAGIGNAVLLATSPSTSVDVWCATSDGRVLGLREEGGSVIVSHTINLNDSRKTPVNVTAILEEGNTLWIGTTLGLFKYILSTGRLSEQPGFSDAVAGMIRTGDGKLWMVVAGKGVYSVDGNAVRLERVLRKPLSCIVTTSDGNLWMGTEEGEILMYATARRQLEDYTQKCGMNGDIVNCLVADTYNHIWIETNQEIKEFNPQNGAYIAYHTGRYGFPPGRLQAKAAFYGGGGQVYFGGVGGVVSLPVSQQLESIPENRGTEITDVIVEGQSLIGQAGEAGAGEDRIELSPDRQNVEIQFSSLDYQFQDRIRYAYRMDGVDDGWVYTQDGRNSAVYNNLGGGTYTFRVKATDRNGLWSDRETTLIIRRLPAWYETWWAYGVYILTAGGVIWMAIRLYKEGIRRKNNLKLIEKMRSLEDVGKNGADSAPAFFLPKGYTSQDDRMVRKALEFVGLHLDDPHLGVNMLSEHLGVSRSTLTRKMKAITGQTPLDFIKHIKMQTACKMLENPTTTVSEVAQALGYSDRKYFTELFKAAYGETPNDYHKRYSC